MFTLTYCFDEYYSRGPSVGAGLEFHQGRRKLKATTQPQAVDEARKLRGSIQQRYNDDHPTRRSGFSKLNICRNGKIIAKMV